MTPDRTTLPLAGDVGHLQVVISTIHNITSSDDGYCELKFIYLTWSLYVLFSTSRLHTVHKSVLLVRIQVKSL